MLWQDCDRSKSYALDHSDMHSKIVGKKHQFFVTIRQKRFFSVTGGGGAELY